MLFSIFSQGPRSLNPHQALVKYIIYLMLNGKAQRRQVRGGLQLHPRPVQQPGVPGRVRRAIAQQRRHLAQPRGRRALGQRVEELEQRHLGRRLPAPRPRLARDPPRASPALEYTT